MTTQTGQAPPAELATTNLKRGMRGITRLALALAVMGAALIAAPAPAQAVSGGGCRTVSAIRSCISLQGNSLRGDFYLVAGPDTAICHASLNLYRNGSWTGVSQGYDLTYRGVYGPIWFNAAMLPAKSQTAFTRVYVFYCDWTLHYYADSPTMSYLA